MLWKRASLATLLVMLLAGATSNTGHAAVIVLGGSSDSSSGLGASRPHRVWLGGDASTTYFRLRWRSWGRASAKASGRGYAEPPYAQSVPVRMLASRRGSCRGRRAYLRLKVSKYTNGSWSRYYSVGDICR